MEGKYQNSLIFNEKIMKNIEKMRSDLLVYTNGMILPTNDLMSLPAMEKLMITQITDAKVIKK